MLPLENRLIKKTDFDKIYQTGRSIYFGDIAIRILKTNKKESRIGFVVSRKFSLLAVKRNWVRRHLRELIRKNLKEIKKGFDLIVTPKKNVSLEKKAINWQNDLKKALEKGKIIIKK